MDTPSSDSIKALFGNVVKPAKTVSSTETKNKYQVIASKNKRELAICCSLVLMLNSNKSNTIGFRVRRIELYQGDLGMIKSAFGLKPIGKGVYKLEDGTPTNFLRFESADIPLVIAPTSPYEIYSVIKEHKVCEEIKKALIETINIAEAKLEVTPEVLLYIIGADVEALPTEIPLAYSAPVVWSTLGVVVPDPSTPKK